MSQTTERSIPNGIEAIMTDQEIKNMRNLDGWAIGTVIHAVDGESVEVFEDAWIELFNGKGCANQFGGVRFMTVGPGGLTEAYAYATEDAYDESGSESGYYVDHYDEPVDPDYGESRPRWQ